MRCRAALAAACLLLVLLGSSSAPAAPRNDASTALRSEVSPVAITREFFRALDHRRWRRACSLMLTGTRQFTLWHHPCPGALRAVFRTSYQEPSFNRDHWVSARITSISPATTIPTGVEMSFQLSDIYKCQELPHRKPCSQRFLSLPHEERLFLAKDARGRWRVDKTGAILPDMEYPLPQSPEALLFAPTTRAGLRRPAQLPPPPFSCVGQTIAEVHDARGDYERPWARGPIKTPWLDITSISATRMGPEALCVAIGLVQAPHPDSQYEISWHPPETKGSSEAMGGTRRWGDFHVEIAVDGDGVAHPLIDKLGALSWPPFAPDLPRFGFSGGKLEVELTSLQGFQPGQTWALSAVAEAEPSNYDALLRHRLPAWDQAPDHECVLYPSGKLVSEFFCQGSSI